MVVAFDRPEPTFRHEMIPSYKATRSEAPDILRQQMGLVRQLVDTMRIPVVEAPGFEADDVLATLATKAAAAGDDVIVVTGDRDTYQLVEDPHIKVLYVLRGVSDYVLYDEAKIAERTGVTPRQYPEFAALRGDPSDNLPGVPGVGEKTAAKLINTYGDLETIYAHLDDLTPRLRESLVGAEPSVRSNAMATPLVRDLPVSIDPAEATLGGWDEAELRRIFAFLEFGPALWDRFVAATGLGKPDAAESPAPGEQLALEVERLSGASEAVRRLNDWERERPELAVAPSWEGAEGRSALAGLAFVQVGGASGELAGAGTAEPSGEREGDGGEPVHAWWLAWRNPRGARVTGALASLLGPGGVAVSAHNAKALMRGLAAFGVDLANLQLDTSVAAYLVDPAGDQYVLEQLAARYAGIALRPPGPRRPGSSTCPGAPSRRSWRPSAPAPLPALSGLCRRRWSRGACRSSTTKLRGPWCASLPAWNWSASASTPPSWPASAASSPTRLAASKGRSTSSRAPRSWSTRCSRSARSSTNKLGLKPGKKTKTGLSTDNQTLEKIREEHPIIPAILRYREVEKLRSTYTDALLAEVGTDGRIHATFNQTVARTGRLSSDAPNLHNIPIRTEEGRQLRRVFVPAEGMRLLVADYNQIELRVIAHLAQDPGLVEAFRTGEDIHRMTAARIFGVEPSEVTIGMRSKAKMVSYGLAYGMESYGLAQRLGIEVDEASQILNAYFENFPRVRAYMDSVVAEARDKGYTETLFGRRRMIPELSSPRYQERMAGSAKR
jgi:DNA polymerase-1